ncbi:hypothetical protein LCM23_06230 [Cytobacillus kochii]|uniref:hypothetical protein n=1 Tax=Cytobacillus kochii TaxID=859143 RepID=UPI001CD4A097|nr:hypothetical protein [Cytobacillus kochii]MCA1025682.1 hypothetical protein [Cytobacillus kochii]
MPDIELVTQASLENSMKNKADIDHTHTSEQIADATEIGKSLLEAIDQSSARSVIGAGTSNQNLSTMSEAEALAGTATTARGITATVLNKAVTSKLPAFTVSESMWNELVSRIVNLENPPTEGE